MKKILGNSFLQGGIFLLTANIIIGGMNYFYNILSSRLLGPEGYGNITTLFAYMAVLTIPLTSISTILIQRIGLREENKKQFVLAIEKWTYLQYKKYWYIIVFLLLFIPMLPRITNLTPVAAYSIIPLFLISIIANVYEGLLTGIQKFFLASFIGVVAVFIKLLGPLLGFVVPNPLFIVISLFNVSLLVKIILNKIALNSNLHDIPVAERLEIKKDIWDVLWNRQFLLTIGSVFSIALINNLDMIYAKKILTAENAGLFAGWSLFAKIIMYIFGPLLSMSYVFFASKKQGMYHHLVLVVSLILLVVLSVALNIGYGMFDQKLIYLLLGEKFLPLKPFVEWAALFGMGYVMVMFLNNYFLAKESRVTTILPIMTTIYFPALVYFGRELSSMIFFNTIFMFIILLVYLLAFFKEKIIALFE